MSWEKNKLKEQNNPLGEREKPVKEASGKTAQKK